MRLMNLFPQAKRTGRILVLGELLLDFIPTQSGMRLCEPGTVVKTVSGSAGIFACAAAALGVRVGSCFHVIWNQEREAAGLDQKESHDLQAAIQVGVEAVKVLIQEDRKKG